MEKLKCVTGWWLQPTPLKNMSSSIEMMTFPRYGKIKNDPNHQPGYYCSTITASEKKI